MPARSISALNNENFIIENNDGTRKDFKSDTLFCLGPMERGPVQIEREAKIIKPKERMNSVFASKTQRFNGPENENDCDVGPGLYTLPDEKQPGGVILPERKTRAKRGRKAGERMPGPGQYTISRTFVKKGFSKLFIPKMKK